jgi:membrane-bound lytic murein transglycosylase D
LALAPEQSTRRTTVKARKGDTVALIARRHKISAENLAQWNRVAASASFRAGETVVLYLPTQAGGKSAGKPAARQAGKQTGKQTGKPTIKQTAKQTDKSASASTRKPAQAGQKADPKR